MEIALIENLQRKDLTRSKRRTGFKILGESYGYTHEAMAEKLGKSRSSITEILSLSAMPEEVARYVGWPTFSPSHCFCRLFARVIRRKWWLSSSV